MLKTKEQVPCFSVILCCARGDAQMGEAEGSAGLGLNLGQTGSPDGTPLPGSAFWQLSGGGWAGCLDVCFMLLSPRPHAPTPPRGPALLSDAPEPGATFRPCSAFGFWFALAPPERDGVVAD